MSKLTQAIVVGVVAFILLLVALVNQPLDPYGKPLPPESDLGRIIKVVFAFVVAVLGALYVYKFGYISIWERNGSERR
jgi:multisubunit Na+/H+ antiporter MnhB subunit